MPKTCKACDSEKVIPGTRLLDQGEGSDGRTRVMICGNPGAMVFKERTFAEVVADVCCDCGHVELRCRGDLRKLWAAYRKGKRP